MECGVLLKRYVRFGEQFVLNMSCAGYTKIAWSVDILARAEKAEIWR